MRHPLAVGTAAAFLFLSHGAQAETAVASLKDLAGKDVGTFEVADTASGTALVTLKVNGLPPGPHAFHLHEKGMCDPATKFESAGGHLAGGKSHGIMHDNGPHPGDFPNIHVKSDGTATLEIFVDAKTAGASWLSSTAALQDDGSAVVIHAGAGDYRSQPSGQAGDRIACGVLKKK